MQVASLPSQYYCNEESVRVNFSSLLAVLCGGDCRLEEEILSNTIFM